MSRPKVLSAALLVLLALVGASCGSAESPAATVGDVEISGDSLQDELEQIRGNTAYQEAIEQSYGAPLQGVSKGTFGSAFVAQLLSLRVYYALIERHLEKEGISVSSDDQKRASEVLEESLAGLGKGVSKKFSAAQRERMTRQQALVFAISNADAEGYYAEHKEIFSEACLSHILFGGGATETEDKAAADDVRAQLDGGADFGQLARERSSDTGSAPAGGDLGCQLLSNYVEEFAEAAAEAPLNQLVGPLKTEFGYHLLIVRSRTPKPFEEIADLVESKAEEAKRAELDQFLLDATCGKRTKISIDPQYGRWDRSECDSGGIGRVSPPKGSATTSSTTGE